MPALIDRLNERLDQGFDDALLRFALGKALLDAKDMERAASHLREAVLKAPDFSAAWAQLGRCELALGHEAAALNAWEKGCAAARLRGEIQAERQISVWLKRARKGT